MNRDIDRRLAALGSRPNSSPSFTPTPEQWARVNIEELVFLEAVACDHEVTGNMADVTARLSPEDQARLTSILARLGWEPDGEGVCAAATPGPRQPGENE